MKRQPPLYFFSPNGEDLLVWNLLESNPVGFYVDVGALDGTFVNHTLSFAYYGWDGICVEPHPYYFELCQFSRPTSCCLQMACVADNRITSTLYYSEETGYFSGTHCDPAEVEEEYRQLGLKFRGMEQISVPAMTLNAILEQYGPQDRTINLLSITVNGAELAVLQGLDLQRWRPRIILIDARGDAQKRLVRAYLEEQAYTFARSMGSTMLIFSSPPADADILKRNITRKKTEFNRHPHGHVRLDMK